MIIANYTPPVLLEKTVDRMKKEIIGAVISGHVPLSCKSFSQLADFGDANSYGGFCEEELGEEMIAYFGGRDAHDEMPEGYLNFIKKAQTSIDDWLAEDGLEKSCPPPGWRIARGQDHFNKYGLSGHDSAFERTIGKNKFPSCDLTVLTEGALYRAAHGSNIMPGEYASAKCAANAGMNWAVENGWGDNDLAKWLSEQTLPEYYDALIDGPIPAFSPFLDHAASAKHDSHLEALSLAKNMVREGSWSGKILEVENGIAIQKINRSGDTVQHEIRKLSATVKEGDVVDINYENGKGTVLGLSQGLSVGR